MQADDSASRKHGGTGIGLSLVKEITELHGGYVLNAATEPDGVVSTKRTASAMTTEGLAELLSRTRPVVPALNV